MLYSGAVVLWRVYNPLYLPVPLSRYLSLPLCVCANSEE